MGQITEAVKPYLYLGSPSDWVWGDDVVTFCGGSYHHNSAGFLFKFAHTLF